MTKFDEAHSDTDGWRWLRPIGRQPGVFIAAIVAIGVSASIAAAFLLAAQATRGQLARLVAGTQFAVVLGSQVSRADAEAMRSVLESNPAVGAARLRTREQALTQLVAHSSLVGGSRSNPLPDLWVVTVRRPDSDEAIRSFADDRARLQQTLAAMPGVASVRVDADWLAFVDRWAGVSLGALPVVHRATLAALAAIVFCIVFLAGRTFRNGSDDGAGIGPVLLAGALAGLFGLSLATALGAAIGDMVGSAAIESAGLQPALLARPESPLLVLSGIVLLVSVLGTAIGRLR